MLTVPRLLQTWPATLGDLDVYEVAGHSGLYDEIEDCYILCVVARQTG
jgi:hypothetical protein